MKNIKRLISTVLLIGMLVPTLIMAIPIVSNAAYENTHVNTGNQRVDILEIAKTQLGNTNGSKYGSGNWCAHFVIWCARQAGIDSSIIATTGFACADDMKVPYYSRSSYTPKPGDLVFFNWPSTTQYQWDHVGIVESVNSDGSVTTIEGNNIINGVSAVRRRTYSENGYSEYSRLSSIRGYGVPAYKSNTVHKINSSYGTNFTAYPKSKITAENIFDVYHNQISSTSWIGTTDKCTIHEVYTDGCCKVSYPLDSGGTKTVYSKISLFNTHTHSYTGQRLQEAAHPHEISQRCVDYATCGGFKWTGEYGSSKTCQQCWKINWSVSASSISVEEGKSKSINVSIDGIWPDTAKVVTEGDKSLFSYTLSQGVLTVTGVKSGTGKITISIYSDANKSVLIGSKTIPVTVSKHTHSYVGPSYEKAHPHKKYMKCSVAGCDDYYYTGAEAATYGDPAYEGAHPHNYYRRCTISGCDYFYYTGEKASVKTCSSCWNGSFTASPSYVNVEAGKTQTVNISLSGCVPNNIVITAKYDSSIISVTGSRPTYTFKGIKKGTCDYVISAYSENGTLICSKTIPVTVEAAAVTKITTSSPSKTTYYIGDALDTTGIKLTITYSDGTIKTVTSGFTTSGFSSSTEGSKTVTVSYGGKNSSFSVKVIKPTITINASDCSLEIGESLTATATTDPSGKAVTWKSGNTGIATVSNGKVTAVGEGTVSIYASFTYNGIKYETKISVTVTKPAVTLSSVSVKSLPNKTNYYIGDTLDTSGLSITAKYSDGTTKTITSGCSVTGFDSSVAGTKKVTVSYSGKTTTFEVAVKTPSVTLALESKSLTVGDVYTLSVTSDPKDVTLMWSSYDADIASVSNGKVTAKSEGEVIIKVKFSYNGIVYSDTCTVKVTAAGCKHKYTTVYDAVDSTCTTQGHKSYTLCDDCNAVISGSNEPLPLVDHIPGEYIVTREPTYNVVGIETCFCTGCGKQLDRRQIPILEYVNKFTDIKPSHWFWESVNYVARKGFMSGMSETKFSPNTELTREQFIQILFAMEKKDKTEYGGATGFNDVASGKWYSPAVKWAKQEEITQGVGNGNFGLGASITREQMAKFMMSFAQYRGYNTDIRGDISTYKDAKKVASWAEESMQWCVGVGIYASTSTTEKTLEPRLTVKRAVAATVIMKFVQNTSK